MSTVVAIAAALSFAAQLGNDVSFKLVPRNADNSIFDCTAYTVTPVLSYLPQGSDPSIGTPLTIVPTILAADATGMTLSLTAAQLATMAAALFGLSANYSVKSDTAGGAVLLAGYGSIQISQNPTNPL